MFIRFCNHDDGPWGLLLIVREGSSPHLRRKEVLQAAVWSSFHVDDGTENIAVNLLFEEGHSGLFSQPTILLGYEVDISYCRTTNLGQANTLSRLICNHHETEEDTVLAAISIEDDVCHRTRHTTPYEAYLSLPPTSSMPVREQKNAEPEAASILSKPSDLPITSPSSATISCFELALQGERLCKAGDYRAAIQQFRTALQIGTDDVGVLTAIYSQMGNAYFFEQDYLHALEFHRWDLSLSRRVEDLLGEAKACANLSNCFKMLQKPSEAILCGQRQLEICRRLNDKVTYCRCCSRLLRSDLHLSKHASSVHPSAHEVNAVKIRDFSSKSEACTIPAFVCEDLSFSLILIFREYLKVVRELGDKPAEGRAYGNLGNTHHLLGNFKEAVEYHKKRLRIAKEFGDLPAQRRAYSNLGNSYIFLSDFHFAARSYKHALAIALRLGDEALQAQACFSLGNSCTLLHDYSAAVVYYLRHLHIAWRLRDRLGEGRSQWSLANAYAALGDYRRAYRCSLRHHKIAKELGDEVGLIAAELMTNELLRILSSESAVGDEDGSVCQSQRQQHQEAATAHALQQVLLGDDQQHTTAITTSAASTPPRNILTTSALATSRATTMKENEEEKEALPLSQEELESELALARNVALQFRGSTGTTETPVTFADGALIDEDGDLLSLGGELESDFVVVTTGDEDQPQLVAADSVENAASSSESKPCQPSSLHFSTEDNGTNGFQAHTSSLGDSAELLFDLLVNSQSQRMNDQRCALDENMVENSAESIGEDDSFLDLLIGLQGARMNDQRAVLPDYPGLVISPELHAAAVAVAAGHRRSPSGLNSNLRMPGPQQNRRYPPSSVTRIRSQAPTNTNNNEIVFSPRIRSSSDGLTELGPLNAATQAAANEDLSSEDSFFEMILRLQQRTRLNDQRTDLPVIPQRSPSQDEERSGTRSGTSPQQSRDGLSRLQRVLSVPVAKKRGRHHV
ncbi:unnamed protein product [Schistocephalus solidus]|uniref:C2H2-type domain-containing protein n=1 Tax=Schistocephalus solidus TaxID=70667 RepID=A0A183SLR4_SCHSO|nr:unnamed protein product [Schistocephalus solidus]